MAAGVVGMCDFCTPCAALSPAATAVECRRPWNLSYGAQIIPPWRRISSAGSTCRQSILVGSSRSLSWVRRPVAASVQPPEAETEAADTQTGASAKPKSASPTNELNQAVNKTAATFAPRPSTATKSPAPPGSTLYKVFEVQAYIAMVVGGALSFNLLFPSDHPDLWRLMGMWSVWMFTVPSLRARDCPKKEKEALNYLFIAIPLINITLPLVWKSFGAVWSADVVAFLAFYAWKLEWISNTNKLEDS